MKKTYLFAPVLMMATFLVAFQYHSKHANAEKAVAATKAAAEKKDAEAKKQAAIEQARVDAAKRADARAAEEKQKEDEKRAKWEAVGQRLADEVAANEKMLSANSAAVKTLEGELASARAAKKALTEKFFALDREVELDRISKRTAELEIQRLTEMVAHRAGTTYATSP